jgi:hypothetical protein
VVYIYAIYRAIKSQTLSACSAQSAHHMADLSSSQQPQMFHPDFERDVFMIVLSVCAIITRLLYDSKMLLGRRAGLQSGCYTIGVTLWIPP